MNGNHSFVLSCIRDMEGADKVLDFGCGKGELVSILRENNVGAYGADTYDGMYSGWLDDAVAANDGHIFKIKNGRIPVNDRSFDVVIANQVMEHIPDPIGAFSEIYRVLKPGGRFLCLFPVKQTIFEPHAKLYFIHYLPKNGVYRKIYIYVFLLLGLGHRKKEMSLVENSGFVAQTLRDYCFHHNKNEVYRILAHLFGSRIKPIHTQYINHRLLKKSVQLRPDGWGIFSIIKASISLLRSGVCFYIEKPKK